MPGRPLRALLTRRVPAALAAPDEDGYGDGGNREGDREEDQEFDLELFAVAALFPEETAQGDADCHHEAEAGGADKRQPGQRRWENLPPDAPGGLGWLGGRVDLRGD